MKPNQLNFFAETHEDLPLWSGTCIRVSDQAFKPKPVVKQESFIDLRPQFKGKNTNELAVKSFDPDVPDPDVPDPDVPDCPNRCGNPDLKKIGPITWHCDNCQALFKSPGGTK